jgi:hypothetical protein
LKGLEENAKWKNLENSGQQTPSIGEMHADDRPGPIDWPLACKREFGLGYEVIVKRSRSERQDRLTEQQPRIEKLRIENRQKD